MFLNWSFAVSEENFIHLFKDFLAASRFKKWIWDWLCARRKDTVFIRNWHDLNLFSFQPVSSLCLKNLIWDYSKQNKTRNMKTKNLRLIAVVITIRRVRFDRYNLLLLKLQFTVLKTFNYSKMITKMYSFQLYSILGLLNENRIIVSS